MVQLFRLPSHCLKILSQALESEMHNVIMVVIVNFQLEQSKEQSGITAPFLFEKKKRTSMQVILGCCNRVLLESVMTRVLATENGISLSKI